MTEKEKYLNYIEEQKKKGLIDIHFTLAPDCPKDNTEEELYGELNRMITAPDMPDFEVLGKYSPPEMKTPYQWNDFLKYGILDYDGFRDGDITTETLMSQEEFERRAVHSTRMFTIPDEK